MLGRQSLVPIVPLLCVVVGPALAAPGGEVPPGRPRGRPTRGSLAGLAYHPEHVLVKFRPGVSKAVFEGAIAAAGHTHIRTYRRTGVHLLRVPSGTSVKQAVAELTKDPAVLYAEPDYIVRIRQPLPDDTQFANQWGLHNTGQTGGTPDADIDAPEAWQTQADACSVVVAVIDTGVDYLHEDLTCTMWTNPGETPSNDIDDDGNGYVDDYYGYDFCSSDDAVWDPDPMDDNDHGTHVAGTIAACTNNATGVAGVAPCAQIMALKFIDWSGLFGLTSDAIAALEYATAMGADVTNNSWGGDGYSQAMRDAIADAGAAGLLFVAAAGNFSMNNDVVPGYPASYDLPSIISVAATDHNDDLASFSHWGLSSVDLGAPGVEIWSTLPGNSYGGSIWSGTSMASPHVAGAAALVWAEGPSQTHECVKARILGTVDPVSSLDGKVLTGGRLNLNEALGCDATALQAFAAPGPGFLPGTWTASVNEPVVITAYVTDCCPASGASVTASFGSGEPDAALLDDGAAPDAYAGDGLYSGEWVPMVVGSVPVTVTATEAGHSSAVAAFTAEVIVPVAYTYDDTVPFAWEEISGTGTDLGLYCDDCSLPISLPFDFPFYGANYSEVWANDNGGLSFEGYPLAYENGPIPTTSMNTLIAPFWEDLFLPIVYYEIRGTAPDRRLIVQWQDAEHYLLMLGNPVTFQAILYEGTGEIKFQYLDTYFGDSFYNYGASATVGIQQSAENGLQYSQDSPAVPNGAAILFGPAVVLPQILLEVHPNERGQGPGGGPKLGAMPWQPSGLGPGGWYKFKVYEFEGSADLWIQVCAQCFSSSQNAVGEADRLKLKIDGTVPNDTWGIMSGPAGSYQWHGDADIGNRLTLEFRPAGLVAGTHRIVFSADETPVIWWVRVYDLTETVLQ
jgi:subtilisin family serine protease